MQYDKPIIESFVINFVVKELILICDWILYLNVYIQYVLFRLITLNWEREWPNVEAISLAY